MDNTIDEGLPKAISTNQNTNQMFSGNNMLIILLVFLLILSFLGINLLIISGDFVQRVSNIFGPFFVNFLSALGYTTGTVIDKSADVVTDASKTGIDIAGGAVHSIGDLFIKASNKNGSENKQLSAPAKVPEPKSTKKITDSEPKPDKSTNPIQNPISSVKARWCLVGEYEGRRGCIEISDSDKCLSGQVFPTQQMCLNPTYTSNMPISLKPVPE